MACTGLVFISVSFMTLPLIGAHSRLNVACILRTGGNSCGTSVCGIGRNWGPTRVYHSV